MTLHVFNMWNEDYPFLNFYSLPIKFYLGQRHFNRYNVSRDKLALLCNSTQIFVINSLF